MGDASVWLALARIISAFDIAKARDKDGVLLTPNVAFTSGAAR